MRWRDSGFGAGIQEEAGLARRKVQAGAQFFITQPIFNLEDAARFHNAYCTVAGEPLAMPVFFGLQVLEKDGVIFASVRRKCEKSWTGAAPAWISL